MRILTVRQPWAWAIIHGGKDVENRTRNIAGGYRGPVAIHAGLQADAEAYDLRVFPHVRPDIQAAYRAWYEWNEPGYDLDATHDYAVEIIEGRGIFTKGAILGVVDLVDVHHWSACLEGVFGCSPWAMSDCHHLVLANPRRLATPIPYRGGLGLRRIDADLEARIWAGVVQEGWEVAMHEQSGDYDLAAVPVPTNPYRADRPRVNGGA